MHTTEISTDTAGPIEPSLDREQSARRMLDDSLKLPDEVQKNLLKPPSEKLASHGFSNFAITDGTIEFRPGGDAPATISASTAMGVREDWQIKYPPNTTVSFTADGTINVTSKNGPTITLSGNPKLSTEPNPDNPAAPPNQVAEYPDGTRVTVTSNGTTRIETADGYATTFTVDDPRVLISKTPEDRIARSFQALADQAFAGDENAKEELQRSLSKLKRDNLEVYLATLDRIKANNKDGVLIEGSGDNRFVRFERGDTKIYGLPSIEEIGARQGLRMTSEVIDGKTIYSFHLKAFGADTIVLRASGTVDEIRAKMEQLRTDKERALSKQYGVTFSGDNEKDFRSTDPKKDIITRRPQLDELYGVEQALRVSTPAQFNGKGVKFVFRLLDQTHDANNAAFVANGDRPFVLLEPRAIDRGLNLDGSSGESGKFYPVSGGFPGVVIHELGHSTGEDLGDNFSEGRNPNKYDKALGWTKAGGRWALKAKDGSVYVAYEEGKDYEKGKQFNPHMGRWIRRNEKGQYLDAAGNVVNDIRLAASLNTRELSEVAVVPPTTGYFSRPWEEQAEGLRLFRTSEDSRAHLLYFSPAEYQVMKQMDQDQINKYWPPVLGVPRKIRDINGLLVDYSKEKAEAIKRWEDLHRP